MKRRVYLHMYNKSNEFFVTDHYSMAGATQIDEVDVEFPSEASAQQCQGTEVAPGVFSGCDQSAGDCPSCGE